MKNFNGAFSVLSWSRKGAYSAAFVAALLALPSTRVNGQTLSVANSSLQLNPSGGLSDWMINGADQLAQQSFYYSSGGDVYTLSGISTASTPVFGGTSFDGMTLSTNVSVTYANSAMSLQTQYTLAVDGSGDSLNTVFTILNLTGSSETFNLYQLSAFTLGGASGGQNIQFQGTSYPFTVVQTGPGANLTGSLTGTSLGTSIPVEEMVGMGNFGLSNGDPAPTFGGGSLSESGNVDYGYEFEITLPGDSGVSFSELETVVPEPSCVTLVSCGLLGLGLLRRRGLALFKK